MKSFLINIWRFILNIIEAPVITIISILLIILFLINYIKFDNDNIIMRIVLEFKNNMKRYGDKKNKK